MPDEFKSELFESANMIVVIATIIFFIIMQTLFFRYITANQLKIVLEDKADFFEEYLKHDENANARYLAFKESKQYHNIQEEAIREEKIRDSKNLTETMLWIGIPLILMIILFLFFIILLIFKEHAWDSTDTMLLCFVVFSYITEIFFYFGIIRQYQYYGDQAIFSNLYHSIKSNIDTDILTIKDQRIQHILDNVVVLVNQHPDDKNIIRRYYKQNEDLLVKLGISEEYLTIYAYSHLINLSNIFNLDIFNTIGITEVEH